MLLASPLYFQGQNTKASILLVFSLFMNWKSMCSEIQINKMASSAHCKPDSEVCCTGGLPKDLPSLTGLTFIPVLVFFPHAVLTSSNI